MKAEHRKELETNQLADKIGGLVESFKEGPSRNAIIYGSLFVVVLLLFIVYRWVAANATSTDSGRWLRLEQITNRSDLEAFARENTETEQGRLARFQLARLDLNNGLTNLGSSNPTEAIAAIRRAAESYEKLAGEAAGSPQLAQEALLNAAKARESLGEYDQAKQLYTRLTRDYPRSLKAKDAADQLKSLEASRPVLDILKTLATEKKSEPVTVPPLPEPSR